MTPSPGLQTGLDTQHCDGNHCTCLSSDHSVCAARDCPLDFSLTWSLLLVFPIQLFSADPTFVSPGLLFFFLSWGYQGKFDYLADCIIETTTHCEFIVVL